MNAVSLPLEAREARPRRWTREPLLHFALIGAAIFVLAHFVEQSRQESQVSVIVDAGLRGRLENLYRTQFGVAPSATQLQVIVDEYIDDEVQYREAQRLGLAEGDEIIRRRLIQKFEFLQRDSVANTNPDPAELRAYYDAHPEKFSASEHATFTQVFFSADRGGDARAQARAGEARESLLRGEAPAGDDFPLEHEYAALTRNEVGRIFGSPTFVEGVFSQRPAEWSEPLRSAFGWHLVKVTDAEPATVLPLEQVLPDVRAAWLQDATSEARRKQLDALRARYQIDSRGAHP